MGSKALAVVLALAALAPARAAEGEWTYVVDGFAPSLYEIGVSVYGREGAWKRIAEWNGIRRPYLIREGQRLVMRRKRKLSRARGLQVLLDHWRRHFDLRDPELARAIPRPVPGAAAAPAAVIPAAFVPPPPPEGKRETPEERAAREAEAERLRKAAEKRQEFLREVAVLRVEEPETLPEETSAEKLVAEGEKLLEEKKIDDALERFRRARDKDGEHLPAWLLPIRTLRAEGRGEEEAKLSAEFLERYPQYRALPIFRKRK
jgi:hypothetical protein